MTKRMKLAIVTIMLSMTAIRTDAQLIFNYDVTPAHRAYNAARAFNTDEDFVRGFCYAFDAVSPVMMGYTIQVYRRDFTFGNSYQYTMNVAYIVAPYLLNPAGLLACAYSIYDYLYLHTDPREHAFWSGYAQLLLSAGYNPMILYMDGDIV